jgi:hypothetical protein
MIPARHQDEIVPNKYLNLLFTTLSVESTKLSFFSYFAFIIPTLLETSERSFNTRACSISRKY